MTKHKQKTIDHFRMALQIIFLIIAPAPFATAFAGLKSLASKVASGDALSLSPMLKLCIALLLFTFVFGRFFCGWACAFGTYNDLLYRAGRFLKIRQFKNNAVHKHLPKLKFVVLVLILGLCLLGMRSFMNGKSPWDVFAKLIAFNFHLDGYCIGVILFLVITVGAVFIERFFCRFLCPMGALFTLVSGFSLVRYKKADDNCKKCTLCSVKCPGGISPHHEKSMDQGECFQCMKCQGSCPRGNVHQTFAGREVNPHIMLAVETLLLLLLLYYFHALRF